MSCDEQTFEVRARLRLGGLAYRYDFTSGSGLTALFGPSGAGKSTLLNVVAGLLRPDEGLIRVGSVTLLDTDGRINLKPEQRRCGYVFQDNRLFPHRTVRENLLFGWHCAKPEHRWLTLDDALGFLGIEALLERMPATLSGGEAQRVAIGRALLSGPRFLLMDEPLASLDADRREEILLLIERVRDELKLPILYVSHDRAEVDRLAQTVIPVQRPT